MTVILFFWISGRVGLALHGWDQGASEGPSQCSVMMMMKNHSFLMMMMMMMNSHSYIYIYKFKKMTSFYNADVHVLKNHTKALLYGESVIFHLRNF
jgi:hypothetical protein